MKQNNKGFTLVEMLCTIVIMLLVSATVTVGVRLAVESYTASITASESQTLCTTVLDAVSDVLRYSTHVTDWSEELHFQSDRYDGIRYFAVEGGADGGKVILASDSTDIPAQKLLPTKAYPNGLKVKLKLTPNQAENMVTVQVTALNSNGKELASREMDVQILNPQEDTQ